MKNAQDAHVKTFHVYSNALLELKAISTKYPKYIHHLMNIFMKAPFKNNHLDMVKMVYRKQIENNHALKNDGFSILNHDSIENMEDLIESTLLMHKSRKLVKSIISNKYKNLIKPETFLKFRYFVEKNVSKSKLQNLIGKKLARFKDANEFDEFINVLMKNIDQETIYSIEEKVENLNAIVVSKENSQIIVQVLDYEASKALGAQSWCISYSEKYWEEYNKNTSILSLIGLSEKQQFFIWDFNKKAYDEDFMHGVTVMDGVVVAAHDKADNALDKEYVSKKYKNLIKKVVDFNLEEIEKRLKNIELKDYLKEAILDHFKRKQVGEKK